MSFYDGKGGGDDGFVIDLGETTEVMGLFHRALMDRRHPIPWEEFDREAYEPALLEEARRQWAQRSVAEYQSTAQFAQLLHRLTLIGAPVEMIGAATRLATDECRHAELCARFADCMGGHDDVRVRGGLSLYEPRDGGDGGGELFLACYQTILTVCCFGETLSVPILRALYTVATDPVAERCASLIAGDEEYHERFGWEALAVMTGSLSEAQRQVVTGGLPGLMGHFERVCFGDPERVEALVDQELVLEPGEAPNLGTLQAEEYAFIFYATMESTILPRLAELGYPAQAAWAARRRSSQQR